MLGGLEPLSLSSRCESRWAWIRVSCFSRSTFDDGQQRSAGGTERSADGDQAVDRGTRKGERFLLREAPWHRSALPGISFFWRIVSVVVVQYFYLKRLILSNSLQKLSYLLKEGRPRRHACLLATSLTGLRQVVGAVSWAQVKGQSLQWGSLLQQVCLQPKFCFVVRYFLYLYSFRVWMRLTVSSVSPIPASDATMAQKIQLYFLHVPEISFILRIGSQLVDELMLIISLVSGDRFVRVYPEGLERVVRHRGRLRGPGGRRNPTSPWRRGVLEKKIADWLHRRVLWRRHWFPHQQKSGQ